MMTEPLFPTLPDSARTWIYLADPEIRTETWASVQPEIEAFIREWSSHRRPVLGDVRLLHGRFLVLAAYVEGGDLSGCGIDKSVHRIEALGTSHGIAWRSALDVAWRDPSGAVRTGTRQEFRQAVGSGSVHGATPVFDTSIASLGVLRSAGLERPASRSWHARAFRIPEEPTGPILA